MNSLVSGAGDYRAKHWNIVEMLIIEH